MADRLRGSRSIGAALGLAVALVPGVAWAAPEVDEAAALAQFLAVSPEVRAAASAVEAVRADVVAAGVWANPTVVTDREQVFTAGGPTEQHRLGFEAPLPITGTRPLRLELAETALAGAQARFRQAAFTLALAFRSVFGQAADAEARLPVLKAHEEALRHLMRIVEVRRRAGESAGLDAMRMQLAAAGAAARGASGRAEVEAARGRVAGALGRPLDGAFRAAPVPLPPTADVLIAHALRTHGDLVALAAEREGALVAGTLAGRRQWPEPLLSAGMKQTNEPTVQGLGYMVGLAWPVPLLDRAQGEQARARAARTSVDARLVATRSRIQAEMPGLRTTLVVRLAARDRFTRETLPQLPALVKAAETAYREGASPIDALLGAYEAALDARLRAITLDAEARQAQHELERLVGDTLDAPGRKTP